MIFEIVDKTGRRIRLTKEQWQHITKYHKYMANYLEEIKENLSKPIKITDSIKDEKVRYYYRYLKHIPFSKKYLLVIVNI